MKNIAFLISRLSIKSFFVILIFLFYSTDSYSRAPIKKKETTPNAFIECYSINPVPFILDTFDNLTASFYTDGLCSVGCSITNVPNLIDIELTNFGTASTAIDIGVTYNLRVTDSNTDYVTGTFTGFRIASGGGVLNEDLLNSITIKTYQNGIVGETISGSSLIGLRLLSNPENYAVVFNITLSFDAIEISSSSLASTCSSTKVYYVVMGILT